MSKLNLTWHTKKSKENISTEQPKATLTSSAIKLNGVSLSLLGNPEKVIFAHDTKAKIIAIKACNDDDSSSLMITYNSSNILKDGSVAIRAKDFIEKIQEEMDFSIEEKSKTPCDVTFDGRRKILLVTLPIVPISENDHDNNNYEKAM